MLFRSPFEGRQAAFGRGGGRDGGRGGAAGGRGSGGNGQSAFWLGFNALNAKTPVVVTTEFGTILQYTEQGYPRDPDDLDWQLFMAPRKVQLWINLYWHGEYSADIFRTRHEADKHERLGRLDRRACLFEYEESPAPIAMNAASAILPD